MTPKIPEILLVGRPNVGKSTLFNRLAGKPFALVDDRPGTTRDLKGAEVEWEGRTYRFMDSGGWLPDGEGGRIDDQVGKLIAQRSAKSDYLIFLVDGQQGLTASDRVLARHLHQGGRPVLLAVNKADRMEDQEGFMADFGKLGFGDCVALSAMHGMGTDELLDLLSSKLPADGTVVPEPEGSKPFKIAVLGKPNVGKSSLLNALLGEERLVVDDQPGTTHDAVPVLIEAGERDLMLVDTAGIRAPKQVDSRVEKISIDQALYELQTCQVVLFLLDGEKGITHQDTALARLLFDAFRPVVLVVNKWDIHPKGAEQAWAEKEARRQFKTLDFAPVVFISAKTKLGIQKVLPTAKQAYEQSCRRVTTGAFNRALQEAVNRQAPPYRNGHRLKPLYGFQRQGHPPAFEIFANHAESTVPSYLRFLEDSLRESLDLRYTPMQLVFKNKSPKPGRVRPPKSYRKRGKP